MYEQLDLFEESVHPYKITKPIRLIEFFAGVGFQRMGIERVFKDTTSWRTTEWAVPSILAYDVAHNGNVATTLIEDKEFLSNELFRLGISVNYNDPATLSQIKRLPLEKLQRIYAAIQKNNNLVNIMNVKGKDLGIIDTDKYTYVLTYSFPCQDLSLAGAGGGYESSQANNENQQLNSGDGTRSGLVWEVIRILNECKELGTMPEILVMENVTQVHGLGNVKEWHKLLNELSALGYANFWKDMNGKNYGIPQNRDRTFMISILDRDAIYHFPKKVKLNLCLGDLLEKNVDEKYFLSSDTIDRISHWKGFENPLDDTSGERVCSCLTTHCGKDSNGLQLVEDNLKQQLCNSLIENGLVKEGDVVNHNYSNSRMEKPDIANNDSPGCSPTLTTRPDTLGVCVKNANSKGYLVAHEGDGVDISTRMESHRGTVQKGMSQTLTCQGGNNVGVVVASEYVGTFDYAQSDTLRPTLDDRFHKENKCSGALLASGNQNGIVVNNESLFTDVERSLFTKDGNIKRYVNSDLVDEFKEGQMATTTYPNGYGHGPRTHDESIALNTVDKPVVKQNLRIRKLTPLECWRLMGADDMYFYRLRDIGGLSDAQIYHIAGDGLIVNIPQLLFETMKGE